MLGYPLITFFQMKFVCFQATVSFSFLCFPLPIFLCGILDYSKTAHILCDTDRKSSQGSTKVL